MKMDYLPKHKRDSKNIVAKWCVLIKGKMFRIELEHGTTSGRRMIWVNYKEVLRRDWMFKLVGEDKFHIEGSSFVIRVEPAPSFKYNYSLYINNQSFYEHTKEQTKQFRIWLITINNVAYRVMLDLCSLNLYINDKLRDERREFVNDGTDTRILENGIEFILQTRSSGNKIDGIRHTLLANGIAWKEAKIQEITQGTYESI